MASATAPRDWTVAQHFAIWIGLITTVSGLVGLAVNPDFAVGADATAKSVLGVDWNGWHGVAALAVGLPGLAIAWYPNLAVPYLAYRAITDAAVGVWAMLDDRPLGVLFLPTNGDVVLHIAMAAAATLGIVLGRRASGRAVRVA